MANAEVTIKIHEMDRAGDGTWLGHDGIRSWSDAKRSECTEEFDEARCTVFFVARGTRVSPYMFVAIPLALQVANRDMKWRQANFESLITRSRLRYIQYWTGLLVTATVLTVGGLR